MLTRTDLFAALLGMAHDLGAENRKLAILGEGNVSARTSRDTFLVKASGGSLATLTEADLIEVRFAPLLGMLDRGDLTDQQFEEEMLASRVHSNAGRPSIEALFHAFLLSLDGVAYAGHTHPVSVNQILCSDRAVDFATRPLFPDQIVCCGLALLYIPYANPGLSLARAIRTETLRHCDTYGAPPRVILLENHGIITLGPTPEAVKAAMFMADKAAQIFAGAALLGGPRFLTPDQAGRIANRIDEHYRQRVLKL